MSPAAGHAAAAAAPAVTAAALAATAAMRLDDALNPIVVRELRQAVQGKALAAILLLFLGVEVVAIGGYALLSPSVLNPATFAEAGRGAFLLLLGILLFLTLLFVPFYTGVRMTLERAGDLDLLYVTTLSPRAIVAGKLWAAVLLTAFLFSASLPFMTFTYFLRGVDLPSILVVLAIGFLTVVALAQLSILMAALPTSRVFKVVLGLALLSQTLGVFGMLMAASHDLLRHGVGSRVGSPGFWGPASAVLGAYAALSGLAFFLSVAAITPVAADRARPVRLYLAVTWPLTATAAVLGAEIVPDPSIVTAWMVGEATVLTIALLCAVSERDEPGPRVRRSIPEAGPRRLLAFLVTSGNAGGVVFTALLLAATFGLSAAYSRHLGMPYAGGLHSHVDASMMGLAGYTFCYALLGLFLRKRLRLLSRLAVGHTWVLALVLAAIGSWGPVIAHFLTAAPAARMSGTLYPWLALNPFSVMDTTHRQEYLAVVAVWFGVTALASLPWVLRRWRGFRREP